MDMKISGSGQIASGEYEDIRISGSGSLHGLVRCMNFHSSGSSKGDELECKNEVKVSGSSHFGKSVKAGNFGASGSFSCGGELIVQAEIKCSGSAKCGGAVKCRDLRVLGGLKTNGDVEAEKVEIQGVLNCGGLLNAEDITICFDRGMEIGSIGGSNIVIYRRVNGDHKVRLPLLSSFIKCSSSGSVVVQNAIEGDSIALEHVVAKRVSGRIVAIGAGCEIDLVQYSEQIEISPDAKVGKSEKL